MVSIFSSHFFNWTEQLKDSGHEIFWFDINASGEYVNQIDFVNQYTRWKFRWDFPGRYRLKRFKGINKVVGLFNEKNLEKAFESVLIEKRPQVVHSFALYLSAVPILGVMEKYPGIKWICSTWGSDLYYRQTIKSYRNDLKKVLPKIDFLITDCKRDIGIAQKYGFKGEFLGVFPGRGGYNLSSLKESEVPHQERRQIIIKGYQDHLGRSIPILESLLLLKDELKNFKIFIFGCPPSVIRFLNQENFLSVFDIRVAAQIPHSEVMSEMGQSYIYIGNSLSDGMPNTLLEAIVMQTFPIQSDPGGATSEIITDGINGFLIREPNDIETIAARIRKALNSPRLVKKAIEFNTENLRPNLEKRVVQSRVINMYHFIEKKV